MLRWITPVGILVTCLILSGCKQRAFTHRQVPEAADYFPPDAGDSVITLAAGTYYDRGLPHRLIFGRHYRDVWSAPVEHRVINLGGEVGGLTPVQKGGSFQSFTLRLRDSLNREYVLRSVDKDPSRSLKGILHRNSLINIVRDQTSAANPYGALVASKLAESSGVYHTRPEIVYIPHDREMLGEFYDDFAGTIALFEERADDDWSHASWFGYSEDIKGSENTVRRIASFQHSHIDQEAFLTARLLDMLIGDWSRREDQWRWAWFRDGDTTIMRPIPRDRDHAFFMFNDGLLTRLFGFFTPNMTHFGKRIRNVKSLNYAAWRIDRVMLNELDKDDWIKISEAFYTRLDEKSIRSAIKALPDPVEEIEGRRLERKLLSRRGDIRKAALKYYNQLSKKVTVQGTDKSEVFLIEDGNNDSVIVRIITPDNGDVLYERIFSPAITKEIHLLGFAGNDKFINRSTGGKIALHVYNGTGINDYSALKGRNITLYSNGMETEADVKTVHEPIPCTRDMRDWIHFFYFD